MTSESIASASNRAFAGDVRFDFGGGFGRARRLALVWETETDFAELQMQGVAEAIGSDGFDTGGVRTGLGVRWRVVQFGRNGLMLNVSNHFRYWNGTTTWTGDTSVIEDRASLRAELELEQYGFGFEPTLGYVRRLGRVDDGVWSELTVDAGPYLTFWGTPLVSGEGDRAAVTAGVEELERLLSGARTEVAFGLRLGFRFF